MIHKKISKAVFSLVILLLLSGCVMPEIQSLEDIPGIENVPFLNIGGTPTPRPVPDFIADRAINVMNASAEQDVPALREEVLELLRSPEAEGPTAALQVSSERVATYAADSGRFVDDVRIPDRSILEHDITLAYDLIRILSNPDISGEQIEPLINALERIMLVDRMIVETARQDAEVILKSAKDAGDEVSPVAVNTAQTEVGRVQQAYSSFENAWGQGEVRKGLNVLLPLWDAAAAVRSAWFLKYDEDRDEDGVVDLVELQWGSGPFTLDSDGDGLSDEYEINNTIPYASPGSADTDGDGIPDAEEDLDLDGVPTGLERDYGTDPLKLDTDGDGIGDLAVASGGSLAESGDRDGDGISDESEERLGTNPDHVDTDGDGTPDSQEWHRQEFSVEEYGLNVVLEGLGDQSGSFKAEMMVGAPGFAGNIGAIGNFINIQTGMPVRRVIVSMPYDESLVPGQDEPRIRLYRYDDVQGVMVLLENQTLDPEANRITGESQQLGPIGILYQPIWDAVNPQQ
ncbi:MAG: hypothetical protein PVI81_09890 [Anaerolineales bacterium]|jgi:hypothetical protein